MVSYAPRFPGPAALNRALTLDRDRRDGGGAARWDVLLSDDGLARCHGQAGLHAQPPQRLVQRRHRDLSIAPDRFPQPLNRQPLRAGVEQAR